VNTGQRLSVARVTWLIARLTLRRQLNSLHRTRFSPARTGVGARSGTTTKSGGRSILAAILFPLMVVNGLVLGSRALTNLSAACRNVSEASDKIIVSRYTMSQLVLVECALDQLKQMKDPVKRAKYESAWNDFVDQILLREIQWQPFTDEEEGSRLREMRQVFSHKGAAAFAVENFGRRIVSRGTWPAEKNARSTFLHSVGLIALLWLPILVALPLGINNKDLGQVESSFEWLFTFPVSARALCGSRLFAYAFLNALGWCFLAPFMATVFVAGGYSIPAAGVLGLVATAYMEVMAGALVVVLEIALRKFLTLGQIKNVQALLTIVGTVSLVLFYAVTFQSPVTVFLVHHTTSLSHVFAWNPFLLPLLLAVPSAPAWQFPLGVFGMISAVFAIGAVALIVSELLVRDGLVTAGGPYQGNRASQVTVSRGGWFRGVAAQEMALFARDRNLQVQVLVLPLFLPGFYLLTNYGMLRAVIANPRHAGAMVFALGAYTYLVSAMLLLNRESRTIWYLLSFPYSLASILLRKTAVWAMVGLLYGAGVAAVLVYSSSHLSGNFWGPMLLACYGIGLYAFIAAGIGILTTDVQQAETRTSIGVGATYLYMTLATMYAAAFYAPSLWTRLGQLVFCTLLAFALWQKVSDVCPYLLDPTDLPPRTISLADGMIAAFAFFVLQVLAVVWLHYYSPMPPIAQITWAYVLAGSVVGCAVLCVLWMKELPDLWRQIGLVAGGDAGQTMPAARSVMQGALLGLIAAFGGLIYLHVLGLFPAGRLWKQDTEALSFLAPAGQPIWICVLSILAAPLFEEFIFRGLLFQGLRRSTGPILGIFGSAALFALVHPPIAVIPVFGLGIVAAISFHRSGLIWAPIMAHAVYNACVMFLGRV
jgi:membrane protease YdiL (CAAX protease family)